MSRVNLEDNRARRIRQSSSSYGTARVALVGPYVIPADGPTFHFLNPGAATRDVYLPAKRADGGQWYMISNIGGANSLNVRDDGGVLIQVLGPHTMDSFFSSQYEWVAEALSSGGSLPASAVSFVPSYELSSTNVQDALTELDHEKLAIADASPVALSGSITDISNARQPLFADTIFYVAPTGSDAVGVDARNPATPWATIQHAMDVLRQSYDLSGRNVTVKLADGTYTAGCVLNYGFTGGGLVKISGNTGDPTKVVIDPSAKHDGSSCFVLGGNVITNQATYAGAIPALAIEGVLMRTDSPGVGRGIFVSDGAQAYISGPVIFDTCGGFHLQAARLGRINCFATYTVSGNSGTTTAPAGHAQANGGTITWFNGSIVKAVPNGVSGLKPWMTFFLVASNDGVFNCGGLVLSGSGFSLADWDPTIKWGSCTTGGQISAFPALPGTPIGSVTDISPFVNIIMPGVNFNNVADTPVVIEGWFNNSSGQPVISAGLPFGFSRLRCLDMHVSHASGPIAAASVDLRTAPGGGGVTLLAANSLSAIVTTAENAVGNCTRLAGQVSNCIQPTSLATANTLYLRNTVAQGAPVTADVMICFSMLP